MQGEVLEVPDEAGGERLDRALAALLGESRSQAAGRIERGEVTDASGTVLTKSHRVAPGDELVVAEPAPQPEGDAGVPVPPIRFEDEHVLVLDKPPGLVVHPGTGNPAGTLVQVLGAAGYPLAPAGGEGRPGIVHRLDRDTSGLLAVAKTDRAHAALVAALRRREVERHYLALVQGTPPAPRLRIEAPIGRDPSDRKRFAAVPDGKPAVTHVELLATGVAEEQPVAHLRCRLETGRTHQIRVHLRHAGHPVAGDLTYGASRPLADALGLPRLFLHAHLLRFAHPVSRGEIEIVSPLPEDLEAALGRAGITPGKPN